MRIWLIAGGSLNSLIHVFQRYQIILRPFMADTSPIIHRGILVLDNSVTVVWYESRLMIVLMVVLVCNLWKCLFNGYDHYDML